MREQWLGMYLPVLILILMEVILMPHNGAGANTPVAKSWSKRDIQKAAKLQPSELSYQPSQEADSSKRGKRSGTGRTGRTVGRNLKMKNQPLWRSNEDRTYLQSNDPRSSIDSETPPNPGLSRTVDSPRGREVSNHQKPDLVRSTGTRSAVTYIIDNMLSILCRLIRQLVYQLEPYTSISNTILKMILQFINTVSPFVIGQTPSDLADPPKGIVQKVIDFFNPFKKSDDSEEPSQPPTTDEKGLIGSVIDYFNPFKQWTEPQKTNESLEATLTLLETVLDVMKPFQSVLNIQDVSKPVDNRLVRSLVKVLSNSEAETAASKFSDMSKNSDVAKISPFEMFEPLFTQQASNSPPDFYPRGSNHNRRRTREANACPNLPKNYHKAAGAHRAYKFHITNQNWENARLKCKSESADLAVPEDRQQYDIIVDHAKHTLKTPELRFHAGFHRTHNWTTVNGDLLPFVKWAYHSQDEDMAEKRCGEMIVSDKVDGFNGELCSVQLPFMCERKIPVECA